MHKLKPYKCPVCGAEVPDLLMPVLKHQVMQARPRPYARDRPAGKGSRDGRQVPVTENTDKRSS
ncbi:MAG: hypothetical protein ISP45_27210 [Reyranella sp.]|jgi:hypothetical protein|nr:hypothetical protein [Reyranella sp.]